MGPVQATKVTLTQFIPTAALTDQQYTQPQLTYPQGPAAPTGPAAKQPALTYTYPQAKAVYAFAPQGPDELGFQVGEVLTIISQEGAWWTAKNTQGRQGAIPSNYVQLLS